MRAGGAAAAWEPMLEQVVRERYPRLIAHARLLVRTRSEAEDLVQDALMSTFSGRARFTSVPQVEAYVRRAIVSRFLDQSRRRTHERALLARVAAWPEAADDDVALPGFAAELEEALAALSPRERACVVLRHMEDLSVRETAVLLRISEGAVKRYVADGVRQLNAALGTSDSRTPAEADVTTTGGTR